MKINGKNMQVRLPRIGIVAKLVKSSGMNYKSSWKVKFEIETISTDSNEASPCECS